MKNVTCIVCGVNCELILENVIVDYDLPKSDPHNLRYIITILGALGNKEGYCSNLNLHGGAFGHIELLDIMISKSFDMTLEDKGLCSLECLVNWASAYPEYVALEMAREPVGSYVSF
jgi:hypothetical protein